MRAMARSEISTDDAAEPIRIFRLSRSRNQNGTEIKPARARVQPISFHPEPVLLSSTSAIVW
jgi:hypothetical protein